MPAAGKGNGIGTICRARPCSTTRTTTSSRRARLGRAISSPGNNGIRSWVCMTCATASTPPTSAASSSLTRSDPFGLTDEEEDFELPDQEMTPLSEYGPYPPELGDPQYSGYVTDEWITDIVTSAINILTTAIQDFFAPVDPALPWLPQGWDTPADPGQPVPTGPPPPATPPDVNWPGWEGDVNIDPTLQMGLFGIEPIVSLPIGAFGVGGQGGTLAGGSNTGAGSLPGSFAGLGAGSGGTLGGMGGILGNLYLRHLAKGIYTSPYIYGEEKGLWGGINGKPFGGGKWPSWESLHQSEVYWGNYFRQHGIPSMRAPAEARTINNRGPNGRLLSGGQ